MANEKKGTAQGMEKVTETKNGNLVMVRKPIVDEKGNQLISKDNHPLYAYMVCGYKYPYYPLKENPNPKDSKQSFLRLNVRSTNKKYLSKKEENWKFSKEDMPVVRHTIKKYKKSTNRQPKDWYVKKKKGHKKR